MATWTVMDPNPHHRLNKRVTKLTTTSQKSGPSPQDTILLLWLRELYQSPAAHCAKLFEFLAPFSGPQKRIILGNYSPFFWSHMFCFLGHSLETLH